MKIALINPPEKNRIQSEVPGGVNAPSAVLPPLGLLFLESYLARFRRNHQVKIFDFPALGMDHTAALACIRKFAPRVLGITGHTQNLIDMVILSRSFREENPDAVIVWGGPHVTSFPEQSARFPWVNAAVFGEGEGTLLKIVKVVEKGILSQQTLSAIPGLCFCAPDGKVINTGPAPLVEDLDSLPMPRRQLLDLNRYFQAAGEGGVLSAMVTSRGCPFRCRFCSTPGTPFRANSPQRVADEMETCARLGIEELYLVDDTFNVDGARVEEICREIIRRQINVRWNYRGRVDLVDPEQLKLARQAGCSRIQLGVETGTDEGMKVLGKGITTGQVRKVFRWIREAGLVSMAYFMIGSPHEKTRDDVIKTLDFAKEISPDYALFGVLTPYPGTAIYDEGVLKGVIDPARWEKFVTRPDPDFIPPVWTEFFTPEELAGMLREIYRKFYGRPGYVLGEVLKIRSPRHLWQKIKAAAGIFFSS